MIEQKVINTSEKLQRATSFLKSSLKESSAIERSLEKKSLTLKKKIVEDRDRTLKRLASGGRGKGTGGVLGSALNILGVGAGAGGVKLLTRGLRRTPNTPSQLLKMQRGTSVSRLSRIGRVGRLAKPLAVVGAGLDFVGRKAEGQTNTQAGVGAAGGFAGGLAGAKIGATFGSFAGPIGTIVGGTGGAIIGSLAGGRIADLFTGANRRRRFEEERVQISTAKTLFSDSLDDFDEVLNKLEKLSPNLTIKSSEEEDDRKPKKFIPFTPPPPPKPPSNKFPPQPTDNPDQVAREFLIYLSAASMTVQMLFSLEAGDILAAFVKFLIFSNRKNLSPKKIQELYNRVIRIIKPKSVEPKVEIIKKTDSPLLKKIRKIDNETFLAEERIRKLKEFVDNLNIAEENLLKLSDSRDLSELFDKFNELTEEGKRAIEELLATKRQEKEIMDDVQLLRRFIKGDTLQEILGADLTLEDLNSALRGAFAAIDDGIKEGKFDDRELLFIQKLRNKLDDALENLREEMVKKQFKPKLKDDPKFKGDIRYNSIFDEDNFDTETMKRLLDLFPDTSSNLEPPSSSNIASNNIFMMGNDGGGGNTPPPPIINDNGTPIAMLTQDPFRVIMLERQINQSFTT